MAGLCCSRAVTTSIPPVARIQPTPSRNLTTFRGPSKGTTYTVPELSRGGLVFKLLCWRQAQQDKPWSAGLRRVSPARWRQAFQRRNVLLVAPRGSLRRRSRASCSGGELGALTGGWFRRSIPTRSAPRGPAQSLARCKTPPCKRSASACVWFHCLLPGRFGGKQAAVRLTALR